jgi:hypothetical protein
MSESIGQGGIALHPRGIGDILGTALRLYRRYWSTLLAIAGIVVIPLTLLQYTGGHWLRAHGWAAVSASLMAALAALLIYQVLTGAITRAVAAEIAGQRPGVEQSYRFGLIRLGPVLLVSVLVGLATAGGLILLVIPGIYVGVRLAVSIEALVVEGRRGTQAMARSWSLVGGHWWHSFAVLLVAGLLTGLVSSILTSLVGGMGWLVQAVAAALAMTVTLPYAVLVGVLLYLDLRARREPLSPETLTSDLQDSAV